MKYKLFIDLDGVLVDFDRGVFEVFGTYPHQMKLYHMWNGLAKADDFFVHLNWMADGRDLWDFVKTFNPTILTGLPRGRWAEDQKRRWCARELGPDVPVITCWSRQKAKHGRRATPEGIVPVLVDDRGQLKESWEAMGGVFIHHVSTEESIKQLQKVLG